jgi:hypothetical protein
VPDLTGSDVEEKACFSAISKFLDQLIHVGNWNFLSANALDVDVCLSFAAHRSMVKNRDAVPRTKP